MCSSCPRELSEAKKAMSIHSGLCKLQKVHVSKKKKPSTSSFLSETVIAGLVLYKYSHD